MFRRLKIFTLGVFVMLLSACSQPSPKDYADATPIFDIRTYFNGEVMAHGILQDWKGKVTHRFDVRMVGTVTENGLRLEEYFTYSDGDKDERVWQFSFDDEHNFSGTAGDTVGVAKGQQYGNAVNMNYTLRIPRGDGTIDLFFDDWLFLLNDTTVINVATMKKFGIPVGKLTISFTKAS